MWVHEAVAESLKHNDVDVMFGVAGDANLFMVNSFVNLAGGTFVASCHEGGAVLMAHGFAGVSGRLGVATTTHGPGLTNTTTALVEGVRSRTPILVIAGDTATQDKVNLQYVEQRDIVIPTGAGFEQARSPETVVDDLSVAIRRALVERRPVVLNIPKDYQWEEVDYTPTPAGLALPSASMPNPAELDSAVGIIASSNRPVIVAGRGAARQEARDSLVRLGERIGAPLSTTLRGKDLFRGEPFNIGICGDLATPVGLDTISNSDCIIAFGASLNHLTTDGGRIIEGKRIVHCDIDASSIGRHVPVDAGVVGDTALLADTIIEWLDEADVPPSGYRSDSLAGRIANEGHEEFKRNNRPGTVDIRDALICIEESLDSDRTLVADCGRFMTETVKILTVPDPMSYVHGGNFGSIGLGVGNAIGASYAAADRPTLLVTGDGGFMLGGVAEFNTAVRHGRDLIVVVMNDRSYGAEYIQYLARNIDPGLSLFDWPDFATLAEALGGSGFTVSGADDLESLSEVFAKRSGPLLIDVQLDVDSMPTPARY